MKTLIINGSPRKNGNTVALIDQMKIQLTGDIKEINTYFNNIHPCIDCRFCWTNSSCSIEDEMSEIYSYINEADNIIIASPIYFSELSGSLLNFASRFQFYYASRRIRVDNQIHIKKKKGAIILVAGGDSSDIEGRALRTGNIIFRHLNTELVGTVLSLQTDSVCGMVGKLAKNDIEALNKLNEISAILNETTMNYQET